MNNEEKLCATNKVLWSISNESRNMSIFGTNVTPHNNTKNVLQMPHALGQVTRMIFRLPCECLWARVDHRISSFLLRTALDKASVHFLFASLVFTLVKNHSVVVEPTCLCSCLGNIYGKGHFYSYILLWLLDRWMLLFILCTTWGPRCVYIASFCSPL